MSVRENGKTGPRPSRLVGNFPHPTLLRSPSFPFREHGGCGPSQVSRFSLLTRVVRTEVAEGAAIWNFNSASDWLPSGCVKFLDTINKSKAHDCKRNLSPTTLKGNQMISSFTDSTFLRSSFFWSLASFVFSKLILS